MDLTHEQPLARAEQGVVYAEFIVAFPPFFLTFLGLVQLAFIAAGSMVVQTAAVKSVRAAAVVLDDDPFFYEGEERGLLDFNGSTNDDGWMDGVGAQLSEQGGANWLITGPEFDEQGNCVPSCETDAEGRCIQCDRVGENGECLQECRRTNQLGQLQNRGGPRLRAIRRAAYLPLAAISPEWSTVVSWFPSINISSGSDAEDRYSVRRTGIGLGPAWRLATGFLAYNPIAAAVNFPQSPLSDELRNDAEGFNGELRFARPEPITVRVTYLFQCGVPIANLFVCDSLLGMTGVEDTLRAARDFDPDDMDLDDYLSIGDDLQEAWDDQEARWTTFRRNFNELQKGAEYPVFQYALFAAPGARFYVLRREATLPVHWAQYRYPTEPQP